MSRTDGERAETVRWGRTTIWAVLLVLLAVAPYLSSLGHPLLRDDRTLLDNPWLAREASPGSVFAQHYWHGTRHEDSDLYRPLTVLSLAWNLRWTAGPAGLQSVNLALHALAVLAAWWMLAGVTGRLDRAPSRSTGPGSAWLGAALFAVHPLCSEAVLFVTGRAEILAALFGLCAFGLFLRVPARSGIAGSALLFGAALGFKESAAAWIVILTVWWLVRRAAGLGDDRAGVALAAWGAMLGLFLVLRGSVVGWAPAAPPWVDNPLMLAEPLQRSANAVLVGARYLGKMLYPASLGVEYGYDQIRLLPLFPWALPGATLALAAWTFIAAQLRRLSHVALFCWIFVPAAFAVTGNVALPIGTIFAERLAYLPLVGWCGLAGYVVARLPLARTATTVLVAAVLILGAGRIWQRTADFADKLTFDEAAARASPRAVKALANVGRSRLRSGLSSEGIAALERAVEIWPYYPFALRLLSEAYARQGDAALADEYRRRAQLAQERLVRGSGP